MAERLRLTVSLVLTGPLAQEIDGLRRALGAAALDRIPPHLTLVPPVNVARADLPVALELVRAAAAASGPIRIELGPPATFHPRTPVVYLVVGGDLDALDELRRALLSGVLAPPPGRTDDRPFVPHVTLDQRIDPGRIPAVLEATAAYRAAASLEAVTVLEFDDASRRWRPIADVRLGRPRVAGRGGLAVMLTTSTRLDPESEALCRQVGAPVVPLPDGGGDPEPSSFAVAARSAGGLAGVACGRTSGADCYLASLVVDVAARHQGVGSQLLRQVELLAAERGATAVRAVVLAGDPLASFLADRGYLPVATLPGWRAGRDEVALVRRLSGRVA